MLPQPKDAIWRTAAAPSRLQREERILLVSCAGGEKKREDKKVTQLKLKDSDQWIRSRTFVLFLVL